MDKATLNIKKQSIKIWLDNSNATPYNQERTDEERKQINIQ